MSDVDLFGNPRTPETMYWLGEKQISAYSLRNADRETQIEAMKTWFFGTYEDPSENTPYVSSEGGYEFIHGGPYGARQVLTSEFSENVGEDLIEELADELDGYSTDWAPKDFGGYDNYLLDSITKFTEHYHAFAATLSSTRLLALENVPFPQQQHLYRLLYVSAIIAFETYLSDNFISSVFKHKARLRQFVERRHFSKGNIPKRDMFKHAETIEGDVKQYLLNFSWHRLTDVSRMFIDTLNVKFPEPLDFLEQAIRVRHDIVHRGGKKKDGTYHQITKEDITRVIDAVDEVVWLIERQMHPEAVRLTDDDTDGLANF